MCVDGGVVLLAGVGRRRHGVHAALHGQCLHGDGVARGLRCGGGRRGGGGGRRGRGGGSRPTRRRLGRHGVAGRGCHRRLLLDGARVRRWRRLRHGTRRHGRRRHGGDRRLQNRLLHLCTFDGLHYYRRLDGLSRCPRLDRRRASHAGNRACRLRHRNRARRACGRPTRIDAG